MNPLFAVVGDVHGEMWAMIRLLCGWEKSRGRRLEFVLQVGDFEPHRDERDLATMAAPAKYRDLGDFPLFARGEAQFPWPVWFIGGNHEPYGWLETLPAGGRVAPDCHFIGRANVVQIGSLRVAGLSGIYKPERFGVARPPVSQFSIQSNTAWIAWNKQDIEQLSRSGPVDVFVLHEWPLLPFDWATLETKVRPPQESGAPWIEMVVRALSPKIIFCGHTHFRWRGAFGSIPVECLAQVSVGRDAFTVYEWDGTTCLEVG